MSSRRVVHKHEAAKRSIESIAVLDVMHGARDRERRLKEKLEDDDSS